MTLKESQEAKDFKKLKKGQKEAVKGVVATAKEDLFKKGYAKHKMSMNHITDWTPGSVSESYRDNYDAVFRNT